MQSCASARHAFNLENAVLEGLKRGGSLTRGMGILIIVTMLQLLVCASGDSGQTSDHAFQRERAISIGSQIYKLRIRGNNKGKSGGYRVYLYLIELEGKIVPIAIFPKNEKPNLSVKELSGHLKALRIELRLAV